MKNAILEKLFNEKYYIWWIILFCFPKFSQFNL